MSRPQVGELRALRQAASDTPVIHTVTRAARTVLGSDVDADEHFIDVCGDSLSALTFSNLLADIFAVEVLVNHALPYPQLFGPNVVETAELIRPALTRRIKPLIYLSTVAVATSVEYFTEDSDIRQMSPTRPIDNTYANGYANSKWAGEVLLREAHDLCGLPTTVFRCDMILAHPHRSNSSMRPTRSPG